MKYCSTLIKMVIIEKQKTIVGKDVEKLEPIALLVII